MKHFMYIKDNSLRNRKNRKNFTQFKIIPVGLLILLFIIPILFCVGLNIEDSLLEKILGQRFTIETLNEIDQEGQSDKYFAQVNYPNLRETRGVELLIEDLEFILHQASIVQTESKGKLSTIKTDNMDYVDNQELIIDKNEENKANSDVLDEKGDINQSDHFNNQLDEEDHFNIDQDKNVQQIIEEDFVPITKDNLIKYDGKYSDKTIYLTFDDGPSILTAEVLDILATYDVKATFFVVGKTDEFSLNMYRRIVNEGHTLGMHSYSHNYNIIYNSVEDFDKDFTKLWNLLYDTTGYRPKIYRFPGGSANSTGKSKIYELIQYLNDKSITYYDWNVLNNDAIGVDYTEEELIENILHGIEKRLVSIVLMHDSKNRRTTVNSLPKLLEELICQGAELLPIDENAPIIQQVKMK